MTDMEVKDVLAFVPDDGWMIAIHVDPAAVRMLCGRRCPRVLVGLYDRVYRDMDSYRRDFGVLREGLFNQDFYVGTTNRKWDFFNERFIPGEWKSVSLAISPYAYSAVRCDWVKANLKGWLGLCEGYGLGECGSMGTLYAQPEFPKAYEYVNRSLGRIESKLRQEIDAWNAH